MRYLALITILFLSVGCQSALQHRSRIPDLSGVYRVAMPGKPEYVLGSGFRVSEDLAVTAAHVVGMLPIVNINGEDAHVLYLDTLSDIAIVHSNTLTGKIYELEFFPELGDVAYAAGYTTKRGVSQLILTQGIVINDGRIDGVVWYNGGIQHGMSGGPLLTIDNRVIGCISGVSLWPPEHINTTMGQCFSSIFIATGIEIMTTLDESEQK